MSKDWNDAYRRGFDAKSAADRVWAKVNKVYEQPTWREQVFSAADLQHKQFAPITFVVEKLIPDGLSMLVGRPKVGKILAGAGYRPRRRVARRRVPRWAQGSHGSVLYCACEDSQRRSRLCRYAHHLVRHFEGHDAVCAWA